MYFDYDYLETATEAVSEGSHGMPIWIYIIIGVCVAVIAAALAYGAFRFFGGKKGNSGVVRSDSTGTVFCSNCNNEYSVISAKCPYCKTGNLRRRRKYGKTGY